MEQIGRDGPFQKYTQENLVAEKAGLKPWGSNKSKIIIQEENDSKRNLQPESDISS